MDPHSRHSQFNQRAPKSGPQAPNIRFIDPMANPKLSVDNPKRSTTGPKKFDPSTLSLTKRPIATNSRVKQDEKYRKDMYLAFVHNALQQKTNGISEPFDELVNQFNSKPLPNGSTPQLTQLRLWILALSHVVSRLERTHSALVHALVNMPWTTLDSATVKSYTVFIGMLISARPEYLSLILGKIAQGFTYQSGMQALDTGVPEASSSPLTRRVVYDRLHSLLQHLLSLVPTLPSTLEPLLLRNFPHKRQNQVAQVTYIRNLLRISVYCPELTEKILATIVDRAIQIDVEIQIEIEELEEEAVQEQDLFELDPFDIVVGQEGEESDAESDDDGDDALSDISSTAGDLDDVDQSDEPPINVTYIQDMVKKLDAILTLIFDHFHRNYTSITTSGILPPPPPLPDLSPLDLLPLPLSPSTTSPSDFQLSRHTSSGSIVPEVLLPPELSQSENVKHPKALLHTQFNTLLSIFDRTILRTFKSRYTQFLIFWYTSLDPEFSDIFQGMLVNHALFESSMDGMMRASIPVVIRAAAASYIGSFVSRATFVDREGTRRVVGMLCEFLKVHLDSIEELIRMGGPETGGITQNTVFYAVSQAVFLIFCFRWRDLLEDGDGDDDLLTGITEGMGKKWMPQLNILQRAVNSVLNPLRVCSANVVIQFAKVAQATDFIYCYTILESNKRSDSNNAEERARSFPSGIYPATLAANSELNTFFPFDPYRLPKSNAYIQGIYREWSSVAIEEDEEDEEEAEEEEGGNNEQVASGPNGFNIPRSNHSVDDDGLGQSLDAMSISPSIHPKLV